ncbi:MAG: hypothetical protein AAF304_09080 [Pseudomonadota bacterium]
MAKLLIEKWSDNKRWVSANAWNLDSFCYRIELCTQLRGTKLKRTARSIRNKELMELNGVNKEKAGSLINALESLGAKVIISE